MTRLFFAVGLLLLCTPFQSSARGTDSLKQKIQQLIASKNATVGVAIVGHNGKDSLSINGGQHFPMQSVFKFHIALAMLSKIDSGKFSLNQKIKIDEKDMLPDFYSPIMEKYPKGVSLAIAQIIDYMVAESDNVGCEVLLRLLGGPGAVEDFFKKKGFKDISIKINEETMQANWDMQYQNWTPPKASNELLNAFFNNSKKLLSKKSHDFIWKVMRGTKTGENRLRAQLPGKTIIAHKTGSSGTNKAGLTAAVNDIGIIFLPNGRHFFISVFVTQSTEDATTNEKIIADIGKATWDYFVVNPG
ncbi:MAG: class A beta-lactamase, subclass A2 [Bacteroidota bacterium]